MNIRNKALAVGAVAGAMFLGATGGAMLSSLVANADTASTVTPTAVTTADTQMGGGAMDPSKGGHVGANGVKEELLTGDTAAKVKAAALAAVPGGTVQRVERLLGGPVGQKLFNAFG